MRIRSTKPEFWRSERIASVSWDARLLLKALESFVDDNGVGRDDIALIVGDLFQRDLIRDPSRTVARVSEGISELHRAGLVHRYEAGGTPVLYLSFWETAQRIDKPQAGRFPRPDGTLNYKDSEIRESVATIREESRSLAPGTGEQGNRGTGEQTLLSIVEADERVPAPKHSGYSEAFLSWWSIYPRKESKGDAWKAWESLRKARLLPDREELEAATVAYSRRVTDPQFRKLPAGWLRDRKWEDDESPQQQRPNPDGWMNA